MKNLNLTPLEKDGLREVANYQIEENYSELTYLYNNTWKGMIGSLVKKELVYDAYKDMEMGHPMFCLTDKGLEACKKIGVSTKHIKFYKGGN